MSRYVTKLIADLRTESRYASKATLEIMDLCMAAADKLEALQRKDEAHAKELQTLQARLDTAEDIISTCAEAIACWNQKV